MRTKLEERTRKFAVSVVKIVAAFPKSAEGQIIGRQLPKAGTSSGANYREANRAESKNDFRSQSWRRGKRSRPDVYGLEICRDTAPGPSEKIAELLDESGQRLAILITIGRRTKKILCE